MLTMTLDDAIKLVRAAGYRVTKPQPGETKKTRVGPTCVARFDDGTVCRMSTHCDDAKLDWERGYALCVAPGSRGIASASKQYSRSRKHSPSSTPASRATPRPSPPSTSSATASLSVSKERLRNELQIAARDRRCRHQRRGQFRRPRRHAVDAGATARGRLPAHLPGWRPAVPPAADVPLRQVDGRGAALVDEVRQRTSAP